MWEGKFKLILPFMLDQVIKYVYTIAVGHFQLSHAMDHLLFVYYRACVKHSRGPIFGELKNREHRLAHQCNTMQHNATSQCSLSLQIQLTQPDQLNVDKWMWKGTKFPKWTQLPIWLRGWNHTVGNPSQIISLDGHLSDTSHPHRKNWKFWDWFFCNQVLHLKLCVAIILSKTPTSLESGSDWGQLGGTSSSPSSFSSSSSSSDNHSHSANPAAV